MRRRHAIAFALAAGFALLLAACDTGGPSSDQPSATSVYRHAMDGAPRSLDPAQASNVYAKMLTVSLFDTLYRYKYLARPYQLTPNLAEAMPRVSPDGLIYTIYIMPHIPPIPPMPGGMPPPIPPIGSLPLPGTTIEDACWRCISSTALIASC